MSIVLDFTLLGYSLLIFLLAGYEWLTLVGFPSLPTETRTSPSELPLVSIILPVRNQAETVVECVRSLVNLEYPNKEVIVVEGGSTDSTRQLLEQFKDKIRIVQEELLPPCWVGKNWACHLGYKQARGDILLFTDGDSIHATDSLSRTVAYLRQSRVSLVTLAPHTILRTFWEKLLQPPIFFLIMLSVGGKQVNDDDRSNSIGNGQYMLMTRDSYEKVGGHEMVKNKIVEDLAIAKNLKREGLKIRFLVAQDAFGVRMYSSLREIWVGWRKNFYTVSDKQRLPRAVLRLFALFFFFVLPFVVLANGVLLIGTVPLNPYLLAGGFMSFWLWLGMIIFYRQGAKINPAYALLLPVAAACYMGIGIDSTIHGALGMGLPWKGRIYGKQVKSSN